MNGNRVTRAALLFVALSIAVPTFGLDFALEVAEAPLRAGQLAGLTLSVLNDGSESVRFELPATVTIRVEAVGRTAVRPASCRPMDPSPTAAIEPGRFVRFRCELALPAAAEGELLLGVEGIDAPSIRVVVAPANAPAEGSRELFEDPDDLFRLSQSYLRNLGPYQPVYFLLGTPLSDSKFQLSFKYRFFNRSAPIARKLPWLTGFHLGYTQTSFWDLASDSKPFEDTSYKPELFYRSLNVPWRPGWLDGFFVQAGVQHESNGRGDAASRSTNLVYLAPIFVLFDPGKGLGVGISPKYKQYFDNDNSANGNPDLPDYRGRFELLVMAGMADGLTVSTTVRPAKRGTSWEVDLSYPLSSSWVESAQIYLRAQYSNALAESLIKYRERTTAFRFGISFVR
jgi:outer membrane phospholipase A